MSAASRHAAVVALPAAARVAAVAAGVLALAACASTPPPPPPPVEVVEEEVEEEPVEEAPRTPSTWDEAVEMYGAECPGPFFELPTPTTVQVGARTWTIKGSTLALEGKAWKGPLKIGVLGAIKDADYDTKLNVKKAAKHFKKLGVHLVIANGDLVGDETGDLPKVFTMLGESIKVPILVHSGNYEWTQAFTNAVASVGKTHPHLFNANLLRHVDLGGVHIFSLPGWSVRKFVKPAACFYGKEQVDALKAQIEPYVEKGELVVVSAHGPPRGRGKQSIDFAFEAGNVGDEDLARMLVDVPVRFGIFSHILEAGGRATSDVVRQPPVKLPMRRPARSLFVNVGSASSYPYAMHGKKTSRGMAAVFTVDDTKSGKARVSFVKLK